MPAARAKRLNRDRATWLSTMPAFAFDMGEQRQAPTEFRLFRAGINVTDKGDFLFDSDAADAVMAAWRAKGDPLMADYEHQSLTDPPMEAPACATEWTPEVRNGELWATNVKWTDRARAYLEAGEYRMFSPAFDRDKETNRITKIINFALTNNPATHQLEPLVAASATSKEPSMEKEQCTACSALSAQLKSVEEKCSALTAELTALKAPKKDDGDGDEKMKALTALRSHVLAVTGKANDAEAIGALQALKSARDELSTVKAELETQKVARLTADFGATLDQASRDGKIAPAQRPYWEGVAKDHGLETGMKMLKGFVDTAVATTSTPGEAKKPNADIVALSAEEEAIARNTGTPIEKMRAFKAKKLGGATA